MGADVVALPAGTYRLTQGTLSVDDELTIRGVAAASTVITGASETGPASVFRAGAILSQANLTLARVTVAGNTATTNNPATDTNSVGAGGILENASDLTLLDAVVSGNTLASKVTSGAGGVLVNGGDLAMINSTISGNRETFGGTTLAAGVQVNASSGTSRITSSTISGNSLATSTATTIGAGGVLINASSALEISNSTITGNGATNAASSTGDAGGLFVNVTSLSLTNATIDSNSASGSGAAAGNLLAEGSATHTLQNTIVAGGVAPTGANCTGAFTSSGGNVESTNQCGLDLALGDQSNTNPLLGALQNNGGLTKTQAIPPTSPAVDAGLAALCPATDQRGVLRPQGLGCDAGAFEAGPPEDVTVPTVSGTPRVGSTLSCGAGSWRGSPSFSFSWLRNGSPIAGPDAPIYRLGRSDAGTAIQCMVTARNAIGSTAAVSAARGVTAFPPPVNRRQPSIAGKLRVGKLLQCHAGGWTGSPTFKFGWLRDGKRIKGTIKSTYRIARRDAGHALQCKVTARNAGGSVVAFSAPRVPTRH